MAQRRTKKKKWTLDDTITLIHARLENRLTYEEALQTLDIKPNTYFLRISRGINDLIPEMHQNKFIKQLVNDKAKFERNLSREKDEKIIPITEDNLYSKLFEMNQETIEFYYLLKIEDKKTFPNGTFLSPKNFYYLIKSAFEHNLQGFKDANRDEQIKLIKENIIKYESQKQIGAIEWFHDKGLRGLTSAKNSPFRKQESLISILEWFDEQYSKQKNQKSWFDLKEEKHLHFWDFHERGIWDDEERVYTALKHFLEENMEEFKQSNREEQIEIIRKNIIEYESGKDSNNGAQQWFYDAGMEQIITKGKPFKKEGSRGSPNKVLKWFDERYSKERKQASWFDLTQKEHLHFWEIREQNMWQDENKLYTALKHTFEENFVGFPKKNREEQIEIIRKNILNYETDDLNTKNGAKQWFLDKGLSGLIQKGFFRKKDSPITVLKWFDERYSKKRKQESWFDLTQKEHLHFWEFHEIGMWQDEEKVYTALKHILEENLALFSGANRDEQIKDRRKNY